MRELFGLLCLLLCLGAHARESLTVIYDSGDTLPLEPYLPKRASQEKTASQDAKRQLPFNLPITTPLNAAGQGHSHPKSITLFAAALVFSRGGSGIARLVGRKARAAYPYRSRWPVG